MNLEMYGHNHGDKVVPPTIVQSIKDILKATSFRVRRGCSDELRSALLSRLQQQGWTDRITVSTESKVTITGIKSDVGLCLQTSNVARIYADILKLQLLFETGKIESGVYVVPSLTAAKKMGSNLANFSRLSQELALFRYIITIPILVIGFMED